MGYRSVITTEHTGVAIPQWFKDKWEAHLSIPTYDGRFHQAKYAGKPRTPIASLYGSKGWEEVLEDLKKVVAEDTEWSGKCLQVIMMHEDGKVNRINVYADKLVIESAIEWEVVDEVHQF